MTSVPGSSGFSLMGDKSKEFYHNAVEFVEKGVAENKSKIFLSRLLNKPTVFVTSNQGVRTVLDGKLIFKNILDDVRIN